MTNLTIVSVATAYGNVVTGETLILVFNEGIDMCAHMDDTLTNPKQYCITESRSATTLSIRTGKFDIRVLLTMFDSFAAVETRLPSWEEVQNCKNLVMPSNSPWHPHDVQEYGKLD
jgi:hypothetical protein